MRVLNIVSHSEKQTVALAKKLAPSFKRGDFISLNGSLGSGKTVFVRGLAGALKVDEAEVSSPSFTFVNEYPGEIPLYHFDLYRIKDSSELYEIGWDEYLGREGLVVVEWGEKAAEMLPARYYRIDFKIISKNDREINISLVQQ